MNAEHALKIVQRHLSNLKKTRETRVIDQDIDPAEGLQSGLNNSLRSSDNIMRVGGGSSSSGLYLSRDRLAGSPGRSAAAAQLQSQVIDDDAGAFGREGSVGMPVRGRFRRPLQSPPGRQSASPSLP